MKTGKTLSELAETLETIRKTAKDYIVPVDFMRMRVGDDSRTPVLTFNNDGGTKASFTPNAWAHQQLSAYADVPRAYYERLITENPVLLADNVNHGFRNQLKQESKPRMLRTIGTSLRAFLSARYKRLDSYDLLETVLPTMIEHKFEVLSTEITERRLYIKAVTPRIQSEVKPGDTVQYGLVVSTSDVGAGSLRVEPLIYRLVCLNGMITSHALRKFHIGKSQASDDIYELLTDDTKELSDRAFWAQVRDVVVNTMSRDIFEKEVDRLRVAANEPIKNYDIPRVVELSMKSVGVVGEKTHQNIVAYLANGADGAGLTRWGLVNGFTAAAQGDHLSYDDSTELERSASKILELPKSEWETISASN